MRLGSRSQFPVENSELLNAPGKLEPADRSWQGNVGKS
jgi:hypothetical protein